MLYMFDHDDDNTLSPVRWHQIFNKNNKGEAINVMQYIGLKDKNGKEIYEGDLIKYLWDYGSGEQSTVDEIKYVGYGFAPFINGIGIENEHEVIGNIYENPELIENNKAA